MNEIEYLKFRIYNYWRPGIEEKEDKRIDCRVGHNRHPNYRLKFDISIQCDSGQLFIPTIIALKRAIFFGVKS